jgi:hypothetical protein
VDISNPAISGRFKTGHFPRSGRDEDLRFSLSSTKRPARYPEITFGPAPGAAHRFATRMRALKMDDATKEESDNRTHLRHRASNGPKSAD